MKSDSHITLTLWTNDPLIARASDVAGINRIGLDLERVGKLKRQQHLSGCWISDHQESQLPAIRNVINQAQLFVRTNPIYAKSKAEIDRLCLMGVQVFMLPMFTTVQEASKFIKFVDGRAKVSLLVEHIAAVKILNELVRLDGVDEICVGVNDLSLSLNLPHRFSVFSLPLMEEIAQTVRGAGISFGFGGMGRVSDRSLPIPSDLIYAQYARLGADSALISRVFLRSEQPALHIGADIAQLRKRLREWFSASPDRLANAHDHLTKLLQTL